MPNTTGIWQHAAHTTDQPTSPSHQKAYLLARIIEEFVGEKKKSGKQDGRQKKRQKRKAMGAAKRIRDCKVELNDTPNIQMGWRWGWVGLGGHQTSQPSLHRYQLNIPHTIRHRATKQPLPSGNLSMQAITNSQHTYIWNDASGIKLDRQHNYINA